tara:strand:+ start:63 stop:509 length:447 start_codon:yes stop_codon:yes gene_type:complete
VDVVLRSAKVVNVFNYPPATDNGCSYIWMCLKDGEEDGMDNLSDVEHQLQEVISPFLTVAIDPIRKRGLIHVKVKNVGLARNARGQRVDIWIHKASIIRKTQLLFQSFLRGDILRVREDGTRLPCGVLGRPVVDSDSYDDAESDGESQ